MDVKFLSKRLRPRRPSPAMVVSIIALVVATAGTATAARVLITSGTQVKTGVLSGSDIKNRSITASDIKSGTITSKQIRKGTLTSSAFSTDTRALLGGGSGATAQEVFRKQGPNNQPGNTAARVVTMSGLAPGIYAIFGKVSMGSRVGDLGVLTELLKSNKTATGRCRLNAAGDEDSAVHPLATPYSELVSTFNTQITRTLSSPGNVYIQCEAPIAWGTSDASIIAIRLGSADRSEVNG